jgi:hypothetical protein
VPPKPGQSHVQYPTGTVQTAQRTEQESTAGSVVEKKTETTTETQNESPDLLSSTVHVVGQVLAFPFRAIGGLIGALF